MLNHLRSMAVFAAVVEAESFTQAGARLGMARGKVSEQIGRLEEYLDARLLQRSTRKVTVTDEGRALYRHVRSFLADATAGASEVKSFSDEVKGTICITASADYFEVLLLPILQSYSKDYPEVQFDLRITEKLLGVIDDSVDLAIRSGSLEDSNLIAIPLSQTSLKIYRGTHHPTPAPRRPSDLAATPWISLSRSPAEQPIQLTHESGKTASFAPKLWHQTDGISSYLKLIESGFGYGVLAEQTGKVLVARGTLQPVLSKWTLAPLKVSVVYPARKLMARRTRLLLDRIRRVSGISASARKEESVGVSPE